VAQEALGQDQRIHWTGPSDSADLKDFGEVLVDIRAEIKDTLERSR
jgi:hypothetical protein